MGWRISLFRGEECLFLKKPNLVDYGTWGNNMVGMEREK